MVEYLISLLLIIALIINQWVFQKNKAKSTLNHQLIRKMELCSHNHGEGYNNNSNNREHNLTIITYNRFIKVMNILQVRYSLQRNPILLLRSLVDEYHHKIQAHLRLVEISNKTKNHMRILVRHFQMECISIHHKLIRFRNRLRDSLRVQEGKIIIIIIW